MMTPEEIGRQLDDLIQAHYYSEDFELVSMMRSFAAGLSTEDRLVLGQLINRRLLAEGSLVDVLLCSVLPSPLQAVALIQLLDRQQQTSPMTRALMEALRHMNTDGAFRAVERFMDSDQEQEALFALSCIDFQRATSYLVRALKKDGNLTACLHLLYERKKRVGMDQFLHELRAMAFAYGADIRARIERAVRVNVPPYNPFQPAELDQISDALRQAG